MKKIKDIRIAIVSSDFRREVRENLEKNCLKTLDKRGVARSQVEMFRVPGALEIPLVVERLAQTGGHDAIIAFGAIVKGKTYHFEQIADECVRGCMNASWRWGVPVIYEVWAVYDIADALERATRKHENKGVEAAESALTMIHLMSEL